MLYRPLLMLLSVWSLYFQDTQKVHFAFQKYWTWLVKSCEWNGPLSPLSLRGDLTDVPFFKCSRRWIGEWEVPIMWELSTEYYTFQQLSLFSLAAVVQFFEHVCTDMSDSIVDSSTCPVVNTDRVWRSLLHLSWHTSQHNMTWHWPLKMHC